MRTGECAAPASSSSVSGDLLLSSSRSARGLLLYPGVHPLFQHVHGQRTCTEQLVVKRAQVELVAELLPRTVAQSQDDHLPHLVRECLARPCDVTVNLSVDVRLIHRRVLVEVIDHLLA